MMQYRFATPEDAALLAPLNQQLIRDEGHRNAMNLAQLAERMRGWLRGDYQAVLFEEGASPIGYALFRRESEYVYKAVICSTGASATRRWPRCIALALAQCMVRCAAFANRRARREYNRS
jgi:hypothetical protein